MPDINSTKPPCDHAVLCFLVALVGNFSRHDLSCLTFSIPSQFENGGFCEIPNVMGSPDCDPSLFSFQGQTLHDCSNIAQVVSKMSQMLVNCGSSFNINFFIGISTFV